ncbi:hypothetical protein N7532_007633 [Penicillium argentinense]|uniref:SANT domain-containing protein n=1 Tax=Penicillium argentinense TaxID=1131581 RepID=A0A9W9K0U1_9EURO|nr:uncharacterized protein N7532_007633 [Penicillium argentinense]KAJ5088949.1 hypothetical protein N7532_007633 [Penicillium argentinense]
MASRFPPSSGFNSRDRSPQRFGDRRPPAARGLDDGSPSFGREPPRGPRALVDSPRGGPYGGGRGRGYGRGDFRDRDRDLRDRDRDRDRDFRDTRDAPPFRRDLDRDWVRRDRDFDPRDNRGGFGRGRSRSPTRDFRDLREPPGRDFDLVRMRRNSRDSLLSASSGGPDGPPPSVSHRGGGSMRGRGRGDWDGGRGRGRPPYHDDRELFRRRSRSRDTWRERGRDRLPDRMPDRMSDRDRDRDVDRDRPSAMVDRIADRDRDRDMRDRDRDRDVDRRDRFDRREEWDVRRPERDDRDRPPESWKRGDRPPSRADNRGSVGPASSIQHSASLAAPASAPAPDRLLEQPPSDQNRKGSIFSGLSGPDVRRDSERSEAPLRPEPSKEPPVQAAQNSPPPSAPQVPAFGSVPTPIPTFSTAKGTSEGRTGHDAPAPAEKDRPAPSVQPPTGSKADRRDLSQQSDTGHHQEEPVRAARTSAQLSEQSPPTAPAAMAKRDSVSASTEPHAPPKSSALNSSPTLTRLPLPAPPPLSKEPSTSPRLSSSNIPTAPRAYQHRQEQLQALSPRGPNKGNKPWVRRSFSRGPSTPNAPPQKESEERDGFPLAEEEKSQREIGAATPEFAERPEKANPPSAVELVKHRSPTSPSMRLPIRSSPPPVPTVEEGPGSEPEQPKMEDSAIIPDFGQSTDEEEENVVFNQEYLEERKRIFEKDMQSLRAELPLSPLEDPDLQSLLLRIQLLGKIAQEQMPEQHFEPLPSVEDEEPPTIATSTASNNERVVSFAPTAPTQEPEAVSQTFVPPVVLHDEITIDSLPFLNSGPPTPISDLEVSHDNAAQLDNFKDIFRSELSKRKKEIATKNAGLREEYMSYYKPWRLTVWELDRKKDKKPMTPGPASPPAPTLPPSPAPVPEVREGRRYKGNSELDFLNALKASEISAQEELERRRTKMATARPDLSREAIIPDMLEPQEKKACIYKDVNNTIDPNQAMDVFGFFLPPNDFTKEEHGMFTDAFMAHPKRWGKIAESLPGRDFRQCIVHYYLTKEEIKYKAKLNKRWSRRGRGKTRSSRPKSNALIADLGVVKPDLEGEDEMPQITETGRPRRAAAPTFGDSNDPEGSTPTRRGQSTKDGEVIEKSSTSRRGGRGGARAQRRTKTTAQQDPKTQGQPASNIPLAAPPRIEVGADGLIENSLGALPQDGEAVTKDMALPASRSRPGRGRAKDGMYVFESTETEPVMAPKQAETGYGSLQPTSYWSVPEQRDFPRLLAHFGRDFEGISNFMKTKTTVMVKNYFQRRLDSGQKDFEEILLIAEDKKARGEATGPLPVPSVAPKRRYEATPSAIVPRPLAPHGELMTEADETRYNLKGKPLAMSPQPVSLHGHPLPEAERGPGRYPTLAQASAAAAVPPVAATLGDDASRAMRAQAGPPSRIQGPRLGYFTEERRDSSLLPHSSSRAQDIPPHPADLARMDPLAQPAYMSTQAPTLLPSTHSRHPSLTQTPASPTQLSRPDIDVPSTHRDPFGQRGYYPLSNHTVGISHSPRPVLSPVKDIPRASATPAPEAPRQVPAKRSNIMSILNDEPEDPQPRKRFASEAPSAPISVSTSTSRSAYPGTGTTRSEEVVKPAGYGQQGQYAPHSRGYAEYPGYGPPPAGGSATSANNDWMARFDPRAPQAGPPQAGPPPPPSSRPAPSVAAQSPFSPYGSAPSQPPGSLNNIPAPSPAPTPPPAASQRSAYPNVFSQPPSGQPAASVRDMPSQPSAYRAVSPPPRASSAAFGSRQEPPPPAQSSPGLFGLPPRQNGSQSAYVSGAASTPASAQPHSQSYQQHVQTLVSGSHRSTPVSMPGVPPQYGHSTPPPQAQGGRSMPSLTSTLGRSYTPPSALHPSVGSSGMAYAPPPPSTPGAMPPLQQRPPGPGSLADPAPPSAHHRVYSQGSTQGGLPGPLHPPSQPPR